MVCEPNRQHPPLHAIDICSVGHKFPTPNMADVHMWKLKAGKFIQVAGLDIGAEEEYKTTWVCYACKSKAAEYKLVSQSAARMGMYCGVCIHDDFTQYRYGAENKETIINAL